MASSFLKKKAEEQAEKIEKKYGPSAYGGTTWLRKQLNGGDNAPAETGAGEQAQDDTWLKGSSLWDDGYQFGDVSKTAYQTVRDTAINFLGGVTEMGEQALDALMWLGNANAKGQYYANGGGWNLEQDKLFEQNHAYTTKGVEDFIKQDLYDGTEVIKSISNEDLVKQTLGVGTEEGSVFGEKTDSLMQSAGQLGATAALSAAGVPAWLVTGVTSFGGEAENALQNGATFEQAGLSAAITAGAEVLTEKISGGIKFGKMGTLDDAVTKALARSISDKTARTLLKFGIDVAGEGGEEVLSGVLSALGQKLTYAGDKSFEELFPTEEAFDAFIGGMLLGGGSDAVKIVGSHAKGVDFTSGLTPQQEALVMQNYNDRVAEAEKSGKVGFRGKNAIYDNILGELKQGTLTGATQQPQTPATGGQQASQQLISDALDDTIAQLTGAPADPVGVALEGFRQSGTVTNKQATDILNSARAVTALVEQTGVKLDGLTMVQRRQAVKNAVQTIAEQNAVDTKEPGSTSATGERSTTDWILDAVYGRSKQNETVEKANAPNVYEQYILRNEDGTPFEAVGAASLNNTGLTNYQDLLTNENAQRDRVDDVRPVEVPKTDSAGRNVSNFVGNAYGSYLTSDSFTSTIQKLILQGDLSHDTLTNEKSIEDAAQTIAQDGVEKSISDIRVDADKGIARPESVAKGTLIYSYLLEVMDAQDDPVARAQIENMAADLFVSMKHLSTAAGRSTQLFSMFRQLSPDGQTRAIAEEINRYVSRMKYLNKLPQDYVVPSLSSENPLFREFADASNAERNATTDTERKEARQRMAEAEDHIYAFIASQIPAKPADKWDAWRHLSMLGNVRTQARNFISTALFMPYRAVKQAVGSIIEMAIPQDQRTKAIIGFSKADRALLEWAKNDRYEPDVDRALRYTARLGESPVGAIIEDHRQIYTQKQLEQIRKFVRKVPARADLIFKRAEYASALAGFLKARGYTVQDILSAKASDTVLSEGRQYAVDEAMKATFNDANAVSDAAAKMQFNGIGTLSKVGNMLLQGAAPYRRTTANLAVRGVEYSPFGLLSGLRDSVSKVKKGEVTAAQAIDKISAGLTGSAALVLGVALAGGLLGLRIRGSHVRDDEKEAGSQEYSLEFSIGGKTYSYRIDWIGPAAVPLFIGANLRDTIVEAGEDLDASLFAKAVTVGWSTVEPIIDISVLSAIGDTLLDAKYSPDGLEFPYVVANLATSYFTQGVPQLARQLAQAIPANERETKVTGTDAITRSAERMLGNLPVVGQFFKTDKLDEQGNPTPRGSLPERLFDVFINPGKVSEVDTSEETRNAMQTEKTISGFTKAFDSLTESFRADSIDQKAVSRLDAAFENYQQLSKDLQAKIREETGGRLKYFLTAKENGISTKTFTELYKTYYAIDNSDGNASAKASQWAYTLEMEQEKGTITASQKNALKDEMKFWQMMPAETSRFDSLTASGLSADKASYIDDLLDSILPPAGKTYATQQQKIDAVTGADGKLTDKEQRTVLKDVLSDSAYDKFLEILELGYSNDDYADSYRIYSKEKEIGGKGTKARTVAAFQKEFSISEAAATTLYEIYVPK